MVHEPTAAIQARILLVDDDPAMLRLLQVMLADYRDLRTALDGPAALSAAREALPDLIVLDRHLPGMDGFEVCRILKADPGFADVPIIFITASDDVAFEAKALGLGAADFIVKPLSAPRVRLRVQLHLKLKRQLDALRQLATTDALTQVANRRSFDDTFAREWARARRGGDPLSLLVIDVDEFKRYNDAYGHPEGDACLLAVARELTAHARRPADVVGRIGGEEFAVLLPATHEEGAKHVAERIRAAVEARALPHAASRVRPVVTVSVGACTFTPPPPPRVSPPPPEVSRLLLSERTLMKCADRALYLAKQAGRNRTAFLTHQDMASEVADNVHPKE